MLSDHNRKSSWTWKKIEGRYANYFKVGYNAFEFVLDFGQYYPETEKAELEKELVTLKKLRAGVVEATDSDVYDQYIMLLEIYHGHAVSEVREEICQGCNMNIPPQLFVEIKKNEDIYHCPQCRRILYYRESTP